MNPFAPTPYLSELQEQSALSLEQNQLLRERNHLFGKQTKVFQTMLRHQVPGIVFEDDKFLDILKGLYVAGRDLWIALDSGARLSGPGNRAARLKMLKERYNLLVEQLDQELGNEDNYFSSQEGVVKRFQAFLNEHNLDKLDANDCRTLIDQLSDVFQDFQELPLGKLLRTEETWNLPGTIRSTGTNQASS